MNGSESEFGAYGLRFHPDFGRLVDELHSRPAAAVAAPVTISHIAILTGQEDVGRVLEQVTALCRRYGASPPYREHFHAVDLGRFELRFERHLEFVTLTFLRPGSGLRPFRDTAVGLVPEDWLAALPGPVVAACHLVLERGGPPDPARIDALFEGHRVRASRVMGDAAVVCTDWRPHGDGFGRFHVSDLGLDPHRAGRLVQRLVEIDTYRMMALLGLPLARRVAPRLTEAERRLAVLTARIGEAQGLADERALLEELFDLATGIERQVAETAFRFGGTRAYHQLVRDRLRELREERFEPFQPLGQFLARRFEPAMRTCGSAAERLEGLSRRISRAADLVRTRVDLELQEQNRALLASMERRAALQLRLQETVEGLSVVVLSYYLVGLAAYLVKGIGPWLGLAPKAQPPLVAAFVPLAVAAVWLGLRRLRRRIVS